MTVDGHVYAPLHSYPQPQSGDKANDKEDAKPSQSEIKAGRSRTTCLLLITLALGVSDDRPCLGANSDRKRSSARAAFERHHHVDAARGHQRSSPRLLAVPHNCQSPLHLLFGRSSYPTMSMQAANFSVCAPTPACSGMLAAIYNVGNKVAPLPHLLPSLSPFLPRAPTILRQPIHPALEVDRVAP